MTLRDFFLGNDPAVIALEDSALREEEILKQAGYGDKSESERKRYMDGYYDAERMRADGEPERHIPAEYRK